MCKKCGFIVVLMTFLCTACANSVDNPVDKSTNAVEKDVDITLKTEELSTEVEVSVDNSVDNSTESVENTTEMMDNTTETVDNMEDILKQAKEYYFYYFTLVKSDGERYSPVYSEKKFLESWDKIKDNKLGDYYQATGWVDRGDFISLMFMPKMCMFVTEQDSPYDWLAKAIHGFVLAKEKYENDEQWDHELSLIPQYHCHVLYAGVNKVPWYIEPHRTETSFIKICAARGNPENK